MLALGNITADAEDKLLSVEPGSIGAYLNVVNTAVSAPVSGFKMIPFLINTGYHFGAFAFLCKRYILLVHSIRITAGTIGLYPVFDLSAEDRIFIHHVPECIRI